MKNCVKTQRLLSSYIDKETNSADTKFVAAHLNECLFCKNEFVEFSKNKERISKKERKILPQEYLIYRLRAAITAGTVRKENSLLSGIGSFSRKLIPIPVTIIVVSIMFLVLTSRSQTSACSWEDNFLNGTPATTETALQLILGV